MRRRPRLVGDRHLAANPVAQVSEEEAGAGLADGLAGGIGLAKPTLGASRRSRRRRQPSHSSITRSRSACLDARAWSSETTAATRPWRRTTCANATSTDIAAHPSTCTTPREGSPGWMRSPRSSHAANCAREVDDVDGRTEQPHTVYRQGALVACRFGGGAACAKHRAGAEGESPLGRCVGPRVAEDVGAATHPDQGPGGHQPRQRVGVDVEARSVGVRGCRGWPRQRPAVDRTSPDDAQLPPSPADDPQARARPTASVVAGRRQCSAPSR